MFIYCTCILTTHDQWTTLSNFKERKMNWRTFTENTVSSCGEKQKTTMFKVPLSKSTPLLNRDQGWVVQSRVKGNPRDSAKSEKVTITKQKIEKLVYHTNTTMNNTSFIIEKCTLFDCHFFMSSMWGYSCFVSQLFLKREVVGLIPGSTNTQGLLNPQPPTVQSNTLPTELMQLRLK